MDTLKPCKPVSNKQLDEMNEQIEQLRDVIGMLSSDLDDLKANLVVDKGTINNLSSDTINTNDLYVNNNAEIKNAIISYIEKNHQYFNTMENHLDFGSFTNEADLDIILRAEEDEQIIKIHIAENMAVSYSNAKSICNSIKLYKKDNKLYLSGNNLKPGKEVLVLIYAASDEFAINQPVPVDAALLGEAKVSSKFDIQSVDRPEWNNKALALLADVVSGGVTKTYKGVLETEDELPQNDNKQGDLYIIKLTKKGYVGEAVFDGLAWAVQSFYELQFYFNKDEVSKLTDDIINGITPVKAVAKGATSGGHTLALTDDALMLYGAQGMDNIPESSSLDDLIKCGQYSADNGLAGTITDKPEEGAFDLIVGYALADKNNPYQIYTSKGKQKAYYRMTVDGMYGDWKELATTDGTVEKAKNALTVAPLGTICNRNTEQVYKIDLDLLEGISSISKSSVKIELYERAGGYVSIVGNGSSRYAYEPDYLFTCVRVPSGRKASPGVKGIFYKINPSNTNKVTVYFKFIGDYSQDYVVLSSYGGKVEDVKIKEAKLDEINGAIEVPIQENITDNSLFNPRYIETRTETLPEGWYLLYEYKLDNVVRSNSFYDFRFEGMMGRYGSTRKCHLSLVGDLRGGKNIANLYGTYLTSTMWGPVDFNEGTIECWWEGNTVRYYFHSKIEYMAISGMGCSSLKCTKVGAPKGEKYLAIGEGNCQVHEAATTESTVKYSESVYAKSITEDLYNFDNITIDGMYSYSYSLSPQYTNVPKELLGKQTYGRLWVISDGYSVLQTLYCTAGIFYRSFNVKGGNLPWYKVNMTLNQ